MHAFLITGGNQEKRQRWIDDKMREWKVGPFDKRELQTDELSIGIAQVRDFQRSLVTGPAAGIIRQSERLTTEAQNALLKTLEEPPAATRIILDSSSADTFLPTIVSRCHVTDLGSAYTHSTEERDQWRKEWSALAKRNPGGAIGTIDTIATSRENALSWLDCGIEALHNQDPLPVRMIRNLLRARSQIVSNVTPKLVLDTLAIDLIRLAS